MPGVRGVMGEGAGGARVEGQRLGLAAWEGEAAQGEGAAGTGEEGER
jgi:hypothetical protein